MSHLEGESSEAAFAGEFAWASKTPGIKASARHVKRRLSLRDAEKHLMRITLDTPP
jgi:hypothetical protein